MAHGQGKGGTSTPRSRGAYGSTRGKERQRRRADNRERDPRYQAAMEEVRQQREALDALIEKQKLEPAEGKVAGAMNAAERKKAEEELLLAQARQDEIAAEAANQPEPEVIEPIRYEDFQYEVDGKPYEGVGPVYPKFNIKTLPKEGDDKFPFASTTAQLMLKAGYHIAYVVEFTGVGYDELRGFPLDHDGYGWADKDKDETPDTSPS